MTAPVAASEQLEASPAEVVTAVRAYLDGGQVAGDRLPAVAARIGVPVARLLAIMRLLFDPHLEERPSVMVVPARYR